MTSSLTSMSVMQMDSKSMKMLGFYPYLIPIILNGSKTTQCQLFDDKNLTVSDKLELVHAPNGDVTKQIGSVTASRG